MIVHRRVFQYLNYKNISVWRDVINAPYQLKKDYNSRLIWAQLDIMNGGRIEKILELILYYRYKTSLLKPSTKVLNVAEKVSIRTDKRGFLSLQFMINADETQPSFVEYLCAPDEEVTDDV